MSATLSPGFADPVQDSQAVFRALMDAMARPGRVHRVAGPEATPAPLNRATASVLLTLADAETPLWLDEPASAAWDWVIFHCGASRAPLGAAQFAVALAAVDWATLNRGTDEEPEQSATLILQVGGLEAGAGLRLSGPGLAGTARLHVDGLPDGFLGWWPTNRRMFPRGVDVILCAGDALTALPRTVTIEAD